MSVGYEHIDLKDCQKRQIYVCNTPNVSTDSVAELTVALLLLTARRLLEGNYRLSHGVLVFAQPETPLSPESFSSRADNGRGLILRAMTKTQCYNLFISYSNQQFDIGYFR